MALRARETFLNVAGETNCSVRCDAALRACSRSRKPLPAGQWFWPFQGAALDRPVRKRWHKVRAIEVAALDFPLLRSTDDFEHGAAPEAIRSRRNRFAGPTLGDLSSTMAWHDAGVHHAP
jgi:hypothetical protein